MKLWHCASCHHEWQGNRVTCDWCKGTGELLEDRPAPPMKEIAAVIISDTEVNKKKLIVRDSKRLPLKIRDRAHMSIGNSFSIKRLVNAHFATDKGIVKGKAWLSGNGYNYGMLPPRYPVPAPLLPDLEYVYMLKLRDELRLSLLELPQGNG